jgi:hypothetical protein
MMDLCPLFRGQQQEEQEIFAQSVKSHTRERSDETGIFVYVYFAQHLSYRSLVMALFQGLCHLSRLMPRPLDPDRIQFSLGRLGGSHCLLSSV